MPEHPEGGRPLPLAGCDSQVRDAILPSLAALHARHVHVLLGISEPKLDNCATLVLHGRDLKPENFLLASPAEDAALKSCDFGLSVFFKPNEVFNDVVGSPLLCGTRGGSSGGQTLMPALISSVPRANA